jgi:hypothetical protein
LFLRLDHPSLHNYDSHVSFFTSLALGMMHGLSFLCINDLA